MKKNFLIISISSIVIFTVIFGTYKWMNARTYQLFGQLTSQVQTANKVVALTFDDGPTKNVDDILQLLEQYNAKATFFLIGEEIEKHPEEAKKIVAAGHQIGNHTHSHKAMIFKSNSFIEQEIEKTDSLIRNLGYTGPIYIRPPYSKKLIIFPYYLYKNNRHTVTWNIEPDTLYKKADDKIDYVKQQIEPGSIILMHPMYDQTGIELQAIEGILQALTAAGYTFVTVEELLKQQQ